MWNYSEQQVAQDHDSPRKQKQTDEPYNNPNFLLGESFQAAM